MKHAEKIYADLWDNTLPLLQKGQYETDPLIADQNDTRRGLTLRARLSEDVVCKVHEFTQKLRQLAPDQYFTPASDLHLTVMTIVSGHAGFQHDTSLDQSYLEIISECIKDLPSPRIKFSGITISPSCVLLQGYPENKSLAEFRNRIREHFKVSSLPHSIDSRYPIKTAHSTIMRFQMAQSSLCDFIRFITEARQYDFGCQEVGEIELVSNDWYHRKSNTRLIGTLSFNKNAGSSR